ncbi:MBL fold metallo-hydrolase [Aestuariibius sp. 2305UL40-4]|uniref:MBL fold metallo-hydrolase n=1 Tax=Aestuariibius violaceus TaxID=3234132 RepID=UPI00345E3300
MELRRRDILKGGLLLTTLGLAGRGWAGGPELTVLSDGFLTLPPAFLYGPLSEEEVAAAIAESGFPVDPLTPPCNVTLLREAGRTVLFDAGAGPEFLPSTGDLPGALEAAGIAPDEVTDIVLTHAHPDHLWGVLDDFGDPAFPEAVIHISATEHAYWSDPGTVETIGEARQSFAVGAARRLSDVADQLRVFEDDAEVLPGITALPTPGHTPGHTSFAVGGGETVIVGDAIANAHIAMVRPGVETANDQDPARAAATRPEFLARLAQPTTRAIGFHWPAGGIGRVTQDGDGYRFLPE